MSSLRRTVSPCQKFGVATWAFGPDFHFLTFSVVSFYARETAGIIQQSATLHLPRVWLWTNGGAEVDSPLQPTEILYDQPESVEALRFIQSLLAEDQSMIPSNDAKQYFGGNYVSAFVAGQVGLVTRCVSFLPALAGTSFDIGMVPYPKGVSSHARYATDLGIWGMSINQKTAHPDEAWRFVSFLSETRGAEICGTQPGRTPVRPAQVDWFPGNLQNPQLFGELLQAGNVRIISKDRLDLQRIIDKEVGHVIDNENSSTAAAQSIVQQADAILKESNR